MPDQGFWRHTRVVPLSDNGQGVLRPPGLPLLTRGNFDPDAPSRVARRREETGIK